MVFAGLELRSPFVAAPMAGVTSPAFRLMAKKGGAALVYTEMVSAMGVMLGGRNTLRLTEVLAEERPVGLQLFGADPEVMGRAAAKVCAMLAGSIDLIDINMGCPVRKIRRQGAGSALLDDPVRAAEVAAAVVEGSSLPVTVKLRLGRYGDDLEGILPGILKAGVVGVALHARTASQLYAGDAHWPAIARLKSWCPVPVIGNGDVNSEEDAVRMMAETGCDMVMIGRAARGDPWVFGRAAALLAGRPVPMVSLAQRREALWEHVDLARRLGGEGHALHFVRQFVMWYTRGLPGAADFRRAAGSAGDLAAITEVLERYFDRLTERAA